MTSAFLKLFGYDEEVLKLPQVTKWIDDAIEGVVEYDSFLGAEDQSAKNKRRECYDDDKNEYIRKVAEIVKVAFPKKKFGSDAEAVLFAYNKINPVSDILSAGSQETQEPKVDEVQNIAQKTEPVAEPIGRAEEKEAESVNNNIQTNNGGTNIMANVNDVTKSDVLSSLDNAAAGAQAPAGAEKKEAKPVLTKASDSSIKAAVGVLTNQRETRIAAAKNMKLQKVVVAKPSIADRIQTKSGAIGKVNEDGTHNVDSIYTQFKTKLGISPAAAPLDSLCAEGGYPTIEALKQRYTNVEALRDAKPNVVYPAKFAKGQKIDTAKHEEFVNIQLCKAYAIEKAIAAAVAQPETQLPLVTPSNALSIKGVVVNDKAYSTQELIKVLVNKTMGQIAENGQIDDNGAITGEKPFYAAVKLAKKTVKVDGQAKQSYAQSITYGNRKDFMSQGGNVMYALNASAEQKKVKVPVVIKDKDDKDMKASVKYLTKATSKNGVTTIKVTTFTLKSDDAFIQIAGQENGTTAAIIGDKLENWGIKAETLNTNRATVTDPAKLAEKRAEKSKKIANDLAEIAATWMSNQTAEASDVDEAMAEAIKNAGGNIGGGKA